MQMLAMKEGGGPSRRLQQIDADASNVHISLFALRCRTLSESMKSMQSLAYWKVKLFQSHGPRYIRAVPADEMAICNK